MSKTQSLLIIANRTGQYQRFVQEKGRLFSEINIGFLSDQVAQGAVRCSVFQATFFGKNPL